jgi:hypothetical protein
MRNRPAEKHLPFNRSQRARSDHKRNRFPMIWSGCGAVLSISNRAAIPVGPNAAVTARSITTRIAVERFDPGRRQIGH